MELATKIDFLQQFPLFRSLSEDEMISLAKMVERKEASKHTYVYRDEDPCHHIYFLLKGVIKIGVNSKDGREVIKSILHPEAMFGELSIIGEEKRQEFARTMDREVIYYSLKVEDFKLLMRQNFDLSMDVLKLFGKKQKRVERRMESLIVKDARTRIVEFLKDNARNRGKQVGYEMLIKHSLTQQDIANFTGTSRQTVTSVLNELKRTNQIYFKRKSILIRDMQSLS